MTNPSLNKPSKQAEYHKYSYTCPHCGSRFTNEDVNRAKAGKAYFILNKHGLSLRAIGRLFDVHPESVRYHIAKFEKLAKAPILVPNIKQEYDDD